MLGKDCCRWVSETEFHCAGRALRWTVFCAVRKRVLELPAAAVGKAQSIEMIHVRCQSICTAPEPMEEGAALPLGLPQSSFLAF